MANDFNTDVTTTDGVDFKSDDDGTRHWPVVKLAWGADGTYNILSEASGKALPVTLYSPLGDSVIDDTADAVKAILQANSGVDIGDVDVLSLIPGVGATNLGKAEDAAHSSGDTGVMSLGVRNDTLSSLVGTDGDYSSFQLDPLGALWTQHAPDIVDSGNSSTIVLSGSATFTGTGVDTLRYASITVMIEASHDSSAGGLIFEYSTDNSNWDSVAPTYTYTAADGARKFQLPTHARYFRVVFTNQRLNSANSL